MVQGFYYCEISEGLGISYATVHTHLKHIYKNSVCARATRLGLGISLSATATAHPCASLDIFIREVSLKLSVKVPVSSEKL